jgi:hypothetical protein
MVVEDPVKPASNNDFVKYAQKGQDRKKFDAVGFVQLFISCRLTTQDQT